MKYLKLITSNTYLFTLLSIILVTPIAVLFNVPIYRQIFGFVTFTIIPGLLILKIMRYGETDFFKKLVLAIGLSLFFLLGTGIAVNFILSFADINTPLALVSITISLTIIILLLWIIAFLRTGNKQYQSSILLKEKKLPGLIWPIVIPLLFPLLSISGSQLMNSTGNNILLMVMIVLIAIYIISISLLRKELNQYVYPIAVLMIGMSLLLMRGLTSNYLIGVDIYSEFSTFKQVANSLNWNIVDLNDNVTGCLSVSLLPVLFKSILGISNLVIPKVIYPLLTSIIPLTGFYIFKKYVGSFYAFIAALFFIFQLPFLYDLTNNMRMEISSIFFALTFLLVFNRDLEEKSRTILLLIFIIGTVVSYYALPYMMLLLLLIIWIVPVIWRLPSSKRNISIGIVAISGILIFLWWSQITHSGFGSFVGFVSASLKNLGLLFTSGSNEIQQAATLLSGSFTDKIMTLIQFFCFFMIGVGTLIVFIRFIRHKIDPGYAVALIATVCIMLFTIVIPYMSKGYSGLRLYVQILVILSPAFVIGVDKIILWLKPRYKNIIISIIVVFIGLGNTFFLYQISGIPYSESLNTTGVRHGVYFVYDREVQAAYWLQNQGSNISNVYIDYTSYGERTGGLFLFTPNTDNKLIITTGLFSRKLYKKSGYIFLRYVNIRDRLAYDYGTVKKPIDISNYEKLLINKSEIYTNNEATIYR